MSVLVQLRAVGGAGPAASDLLALAADASPQSRERLLMGLTDLCRSAGATSKAAPLLGEILLILARQAEREVRKALSHKLADADWAPRALVNVLALDEIEIARPVLTRSPVLRDADLIKVLVEATLEHKIAVARRPGLSAEVADAIVARNDPAILTALASNRDADIDVEAIRKLVEQSRRVASLRSPLVRHPRLTAQLAEQMYQWVGSALRQSICSRFQVDEAKLNQAVREAAQAAAGAGQPVPVGPAPMDPAEQDEADRRLIEKLHAAGQLRPGYLVRSVRERRLGPLIHGLSLLGGLDLDAVRAAMSRTSPEALYFACAAVGIDKAVFPALMTEIRLINGGLPGDEGGRVWREQTLTPAEAVAAFQAASRTYVTV